MSDPNKSRDVGLQDTYIHTITHTHRIRADQSWVYVSNHLSLSPSAGAGLAAVPATVPCQQCVSRPGLHLLSEELCGKLLWLLQRDLSSAVAPWQL